MNRVTDVIDYVIAVLLVLSICVLLAIGGVVLTAGFLAITGVIALVVVGEWFSSLFRRREPTTGKERRDEDGDAEC